MKVLAHWASRVGMALSVAALLPLALTLDVRGITVRMPWLVRQRMLFSVLNHLSWKRLWNIGRAELDRVQKRVLVGSKPYLSIIDPVGNVCNLECPLCVSGGKKDEVAALPKGLMTMETFEHSVAALREHGCATVLYNWGESLLHPRIFDMVRHATDANIGVVISSNLNVLTDAMAEGVVRSGLERLVVSIDGTTEATYRMYRVGGSLEKVLANTRKVQDAKRRLGSRYPVVEFQFIVMRHNEHQLDSIRRLARQYEVDCLSLIPCLMIIEPAEAERFVSTLPMFQTGRVESRLFAEQPTRECEYLWRLVKINWDGGILTCCNCIPGADDSFYHGEIEAGDFAAVWNNAYYQASRAVIAQGLDPARSVRSPKCEKCVGVLPLDAQVALPAGVRGGKGARLLKLVRRAT